MAATPTNPPASSSYVDMLVNGEEGDALTALETVREAGNAARVQSVADDGDAHNAPFASSPEGGSEENDTRGGRQRRSTGREVAFRVSTPDRIRRRSEMLYHEVQAMTERHVSRTGREREVQRRESRNSRVAKWEEGNRRSVSRGDDAPQRKSVTPAPAPLPDVHQLFEESRRAHLAEAQQQRTYFPLSSKPTAYSSKDPSTFSYRFQSTDAAPPGR